jgi:glycosyltransferase involved in cell wall biosynthesis
MDTLVTTESRMYLAPDGNYYPAVNPSINYDFWSRYLDVFQSVRLTARVQEVDIVPQGVLPANGDGVRIIPLPTWTTPWEYLYRRNKIINTVVAEAERCALCLRAPTQISALLRNHVEKGRPYGVEVVGDPWDALGPGTIGSPLRPLLRRKAYYDLKRLCAGASATAYVTETALQKRYPPRPNTFTTHFSSIVLKQEDIVSRAKVSFGPPYHLVHVGTMRVMYKAQDVILHALKLVHDRCNEAVTLTLVGDGKRRDELQMLARSLDISDHVTFVGLLSGPSDVYKELDRADLFLLPSRQEGLPKALLEAMARGLPAIGTRIGGIPELLPPTCLVPPDDPEALAERICSLLGNTHEMRDLAARNLKKAEEYLITNIRSRRIAYYEEVRLLSQEWLTSRARVSRSTAAPKS